MSVVNLPQRLTHLAPVSVAAIMALSLACVYASALPLPLRLAGLALFALLTLIQPVGGLVCTALAAPLYLMPTSIDAAGRRWLFPLHEIALLVTTAVMAGQWAIQRIQRRSLPDPQALAPHIRLAGVTYAPHALLVLAGVIGVALAVPEGRSAALREFRWLIVEPLLFYGLVHATRMPRMLLAGALALSGAWAATIGVLQFVGLDLAPLIGEKRAFSENIIVVDGVRRVTSVYGHPNNLGLFLERVWPLAAALALGLWGEKRSTPMTDSQGVAYAKVCLEKIEAKAQGRTVAQSLPSALTPSHPCVSLSKESSRAAPLFFATCACLALAGVAVSFSRGAWLASVVAATIIGASWRLLRTQERRALRWLALALAGVMIAAVASLALTLRGGPGGGSVDARLLLWRESLSYLQDHPLGLGLDQFYYYHNPAFGRSRIDPSLLGTSEEYAAHPHNLLLDAWINVGPIGALAFGWLLLRFYWNAFSSIRERRDLLAWGALAAMTAALVHGLADRFYFVPDLAIAFWALIAIVERER